MTARGSSWSGSVFVIPAGHDAWVVGDEPFVIVQFDEGESAARRFNVAECGGEGGLSAVRRQTSELREGRVEAALRRSGAMQGLDGGADNGHRPVSEGAPEA